MISLSSALWLLYICFLFIEIGKNGLVSKSSYVYNSFYGRSSLFKFELYLCYSFLINAFYYF